MNSEPTAENINELPQNNEEETREQVYYRADNVREITIEDLNRIENRAADIFYDNDDPGSAQAYVDAELSKLGVSSADYQDGLLPIRVVDSESGKSQLRAMVVEAHDFGTNATRVDLIEVEDEVDGHEGADREVESEEVDDDAEKMEGQREAVEGAIRDLEEQIKDSHLVPALEDQKSQVSRSNHVAGSIINEARSMLREMQYGQMPNPRKLDNLIAESHQVVRMLDAEEQSAVDSRRRSNSISESLEDSVRRVKGSVEDDDLIDNFSAVVRKVSEAQEEVAQYSLRAIHETDDTKQAFQVVNRLLEEMKYSRYGAESYIAQINQAITRAEDGVSGRHHSMLRAVEAAAEMQQMLSNR